MKKMCHLFLLCMCFLIIGCGNNNASKDEITTSSLIQFQPDLVTDNFMYVIEGETYSTQITDYVVENKKTKVIISQIECPNGEVWGNPTNSTGFSMFDSYVAGDAPYIVTFTDTISGESNKLYIVCYTREEATAEGLIQESFTFNSAFIQNDIMNVLDDTIYPTDIAQYVVTDNPSSIKITSCKHPNGNDYIENDFKDTMRLDVYQIAEDYPNIPYTITFTDEITGYTKTLSVYVYPKDTEEKVLFAPSTIDLCTFNFDFVNNQLIVGSIINKEEYKELCYYVSVFLDDYSSQNKDTEYIIPNGIHAASIIDTSINTDNYGTTHFYATMPNIEDCKLYIKYSSSSLTYAHPDERFSIQIVSINEEIN